MRTFLSIELTVMLSLGTVGISLTQDVPKPQGPNQAHTTIHGPRSIDQELDHLTKDLQLTSRNGNRLDPCSRTTATGFRYCSTGIQMSHVQTLAPKSTRSATKRITN